MINLHPFYDVHANKTTFTKIAQPSAFQSVLALPEAVCSKELKAAKFGTVYSCAGVVEHVKPAERSILKDRRWPELYNTVLEMA